MHLYCRTFTYALLPLCSYMYSTASRPSLKEFRRASVHYTSDESTREFSCSCCFLFSGNSKVEASRLDAGIIRRSPSANLSFLIAAGLLKSSFAGLPACSCVFLREQRMVAENETQRRGCLPPAHACYSIASLPHHLERRVADGGCFSH